MELPVDLFASSCQHISHLFYGANHRWSQYVLRSLEHIRAHRHVFVLSVLGSGTTIPKIPLVEEVPYCTANGMTARTKSSDQQNYEPKRNNDFFLSVSLDSNRFNS